MLSPNSAVPSRRARVRACNPRRPYNEALAVSGRIPEYPVVSNTYDQQK